MLRHLTAVASIALLSGPTLQAQTLPAPREHFGFDIGEDGKLADWGELTSYFERLSRGSARVRVDTLGVATAGSPFVMLTITSPENHARLEEIRTIQDLLADPRALSGEQELERLLETGKAVVLLTHGIHATEVGSSQMSASLAYELATSSAPDVLEILDNVVLLQIPSLNPDGLQWVVDWYDEHKGTRFEGAPLPWLYHPYAGHDNNRDWYAFTQRETLLTLTGAHHAWHPHIVHDIHQMGSTGARLFLPPYVDPWEPNVDPALTAAVTALGSHIAAELTNQGKPGVLVNGIYDAYAPARAYMHYHGAVRILSETASADLASPLHVPADRLRPGLNYDPGRASWNFPDPWMGGTWGLPDVVEYQKAAALALLSHAARNRRFWLETSYGVNERAVSGWEGWPSAWIIPAAQDRMSGITYALRSLTLGEVEVHRAETAFTVDGIAFPSGSWVIPMDQPYAAFANTLLEPQAYPALTEYPGGPSQQPYDATAHTLPYLLDFDAVAVDGRVDVPLSPPIEVPDFDFRLPARRAQGAAPRVALYKSWNEDIAAGWHRWLFDRHDLAYDTLHDAEMRSGGLLDYDVLILQGADPATLEGGFPRGTLPDRYAGGLGSAGAAEIRRFVQRGGRVVAIEGGAQYVAELFDLGIRDIVSRIPRNQFYIPGSIVRLEVATEGAVGQGMPPEVAAWFWGTSRAWTVEDTRVRIVARYGEGDLLLSGWATGGDRVAGQPAVLEATIGEGSLVLFGFQPNYRGQSMATWPLLFNAIRE